MKKLLLTVLFLSLSTLAFSGYSSITDVVGAGTLVLERGDWSSGRFVANSTTASTNLTVSETDTLASLRDKINALNYGVTASIIGAGDDTFNLVLNEGDELTGGDMLFMDDGRIVEIPNQNNLMVVFPTYIHHAITPIKSKSGKDVPFPQQRFSIQYWTDVIGSNY